MLSSSSLVLSLLAATAFCAGCGTRTVPRVGVVTVTDTKGNPQPAIASIAHGTSAFFDVAVTQDAEGLGADWTVTCSSALPQGSLPAGTVDTSCGSFAPMHTISGPVPTYPNTLVIVTQFTAPATVPTAGTVTLIVHASSLPSSTASLTLRVI